MKYVMFAVLDKKVGAYNRPMVFRTRGEAVRSFQDAVSDEKSDFRRHAEDYLFCYLGTFDDGSGQVQSVDPPEIVITALDLVVTEGVIQ